MTTEHGYTTNSIAVCASTFTMTTMTGISWYVVPVPKEPIHPQVGIDPEHVVAPARGVDRHGDRCVHGWKSKCLECEGHLL